MANMLLIWRDNRCTKGVVMLRGQKICSLSFSVLQRVRWIIWSSIEVHLVDALAAEGDEGRCSLR